jgi:hypothetical protein
MTRRRPKRRTVGTTHYNPSMVGFKATLLVYQYSRCLPKPWSAADDLKAKLSLPVTCRSKPAKRPFTGRSGIPHRKTYALFNQPPVKPARCNPRTRVGTLRVAFQMILVL